jgi:uroporphyrinogen decarboxylase
MLHNFMVAAREAGYTMKQYREDPEIAAKCHIRFVEKYGVDGVLFDVDTALLAGAVGAPVDFPEDEPARTHEIFLNSLDDVHLLADIDISTNPRIQHSLESIRILKRYFRDEIFIRGNCDQAPFSLACSMRTPANFMMDLMIDEEQTLQLLEYTSRIGIQYIRLMAEAGADMVSNGDSPAGPSMISPEKYQQFALPYEK